MMWQHFGLQLSSREIAQNKRLTGGNNGSISPAQIIFIVPVREGITKPLHWGNKVTLKDADVYTLLFVIVIYAFPCITIDKHAKNQKNYGLIISL